MKKQTWTQHVVINEWANYLKAYGSVGVIERKDKKAKERLIITKKETWPKLCLCFRLRNKQQQMERQGSWRVWSF